MLTVTPDYVTETVAPTAEPVTLGEAKDHLRVSIDDDNNQIINLIKAARQHCESYTGRAFIERTLRADLPCFYEAARLPHKPIISITSVKYYNTASPSILTTLSATNYELSRDVLSRAYGGSWPSIYPRMDSVQITYLAGYATTSSPITDLAENVPDAIKQAMLLIIGDLYENREGQFLYPGAIVANKTVNMLLDYYRVYA